MFGKEKDNIKKIEPNLLHVPMTIFDLRLDEMTDFHLLSYKKQF